MKRTRTLPRSFYRDSPEQVAPRLLGKVLLLRTKDRHGCPIALAGRITEVEAYHGLDDPAAHAFIGCTERNAVLFGPPGFAYVYFIYGMHYCLNVSCEPEGHGSGILFRAVEPLEGREEMARRRKLPLSAAPRLLASGPGRLCQAFGITRQAYNGIDLTRAASPLRIVDDGFVAGEILATPRIGVSKAAERPLRFVLAGNSCVSRA